VVIALAIGYQTTEIERFSAQKGELTDSVFARISRIRELKNLFVLTTLLIIKLKCQD
jgi:hypothetical protein